ncbi:LysR family transcriptional regulator [Thiofilum flexile]|uniref:LysR family transcriptional regulator n=1 Tax=Thiofilum flexile TaxID=125627 RepID=UPI0003811717|nr:LysR family transcriptional regulator [Thiofilum flexile]
MEIPEFEQYCFKKRADKLGITSLIRYKLFGVHNRQGHYEWNSIEDNDGITDDVYGMLAMDRLTALRVFAEVATSGSFTAAADQLEMSRPMVTRYITTLEDWLDTRLLQRTTRYVTLTATGEQVLQHAQQMLALAENIQQETARQDGELYGQLRLTSSLSFGYAQLAAALVAFQAQHPRLNIDLNVNDTAVNLVEARVDLAIRISNAPDPVLIGRPLARCESVLVAAPAYLQQHGIPEQPQDLVKHRCLTHTQVGRYEWQLLRGTQEERVKVFASFTINDATVLMQAVMAGGGVAMLPSYLVLPHLQSGALQAVLPEWQVPALTIYALYPSRRRMLPAVRALLDYLITYFSDMQWSQQQ